MLGTLSKLFSSLLFVLPPTIGGSLLTISLPDVTKEAVDHHQEWEDHHQGRQIQKEEN